MEGLTTIHLGGKLGQLFGKEWRLQVSSPAEAIRAIDVNVKGELKKYLFKQGKSKFYKIGVGSKTSLIGEKELANRSGRSDIYIMPTIQGKNSGLGKILAAVAIVAVTWWNPFSFAAGSTWFTVGYSTAASLAIGGVVQLLTPAPNFNNNSQGESRGSNLFNGNASVATQGGAVGLVYGRALVTPMPISIAFDNEDQIKSDAAGTTEYNTTYDPSTGVVQYPVATSQAN